MFAKIPCKFTITKVSHDQTLPYGQFLPAFIFRLQLTLHDEDQGKGKKINSFI